MKYVGLDTQIRRNNRRSIVLLMCFPLLLFAGLYAFFFFAHQGDYDYINRDFLRLSPFVAGGVGVWFLIAWAGHSSMINASARSETLDRKNNMRVYNLTENLCMSVRDDYAQIAHH